MFDEREATNPAAKQILSILDAGGYYARSGEWVDLGNLQSAAELGTLMYTSEQLQCLRERTAEGNSQSSIEVTDATTQTAAMRLVAGGPVALLNFASARNPGGGSSEALAPRKKNCAGAAGCIEL